MYIMEKNLATCDLPVRAALPDLFRALRETGTAVLSAAPGAQRREPGVPRQFPVARGAAGALFISILGRNPFALRQGSAKAAKHLDAPRRGSAKRSK